MASQSKTILDLEPGVNATPQTLSTIWFHAIQGGLSRRLNLTNLLATTGSGNGGSAFIEMRSSGTWLQYRTDPSGVWINLYDMSTIDPGEGGNAYIEMRATSSYLQYRTSESGSWINLISLSELTGSDGVDGNTLLNGTTAPSGSIGKDGDFYINRSTWYIYGPKASGNWPAGVPMIGEGGGGSGGGNDGADGRTILSGNGNPSSALGENGDFYINLTNWNIHGPKASGNWPAGVSMIGPKGDTIIDIASPSGVNNTFTFDVSTSLYQTATFTGSAAGAVNISNWPVSGKLATLILELTNAGLPPSISWPAAVNWVLSSGAFSTSFAATGVTLQSSGKDFIILWSRDNGSTIYGKVMR